MRQAKMVIRIHRENRVHGTVKTVSKSTFSASCTSLNRCVNQRKIFAVAPTFLSANRPASLAGMSASQTICLGFFLRKKPRGEPTNTKPTKVKRKGAHAAIRS
jgi:hypothetical protein